VEKRALKKSINIVGLIVSTRCWIHATVSKIDRSIDCARQSMQQAALEFAGE
jgi:hypothetical protein